MDHCSKGKQLKQKLSNGEITSGAFLQMVSSISAEIVSSAGFDWVMVDMEHAPGDYANLLQQLQAIQCSEAVPFVRAPWNDAVMLKKILDTGVQGVLVPYVNTAEEAQQAVAGCKYPPLGIRGAAASPRAAGYGQNGAQYLKESNDNVVVIVAIETPEAVENLDQILGVDGIDGIFIGPMDLATSMGYLGDASQPAVQQAIKTIENKVNESNKFLGTVAPQWQKAETCYDKGYQWLVLMQDSTGLSGLANSTVSKFKEFKQK